MTIKDLQMSYTKLLAVGLLAVFLAACQGSPSVPDPEPTDTTYGDGGASTGGTGDGGMGEGEYLDDPSAGELGMVIYFDFDSSEVRQQDKDLVSRHARQIGDNMRMSVRLEGHADERGSPEYNIALGDRRAQSVRSMFELQGVSPQQITIVSYGEEKPAVEGHADTAWRMNRRVEIVYPGY